MKKLIKVLFALLLAVACMTVVLAADEEATVNAEDKNFTTIYRTPEEKLAVMTLATENEDYALYIQMKTEALPNIDTTAEIAVVHKKTGQIMFSNPYNIAESNATPSVKARLLSQIVISYTENDKPKEYTSYNEAVLNDQIVIEPIKNGIRVEYTIGRADANFLVPRLIQKDRFESQILNKLDVEDPYQKWAFGKLNAFYQLQDPSDPTKVDAVKETMYKNYPITKTGMVVYALTDTLTREFKELEGYIKEYAPDYSYDEMEYDHAMTQYVDKTQSIPVFRLAVEYTLSKDGLVVTLPANGIRFDSTLYSLDSVTLLPYMGAGTGNCFCKKDKNGKVVHVEGCVRDYLENGYTFVPDGSGTLMGFDEFIDKNTSIAGTVYGMDFAYQTLDGAANQDVMRMPVFGLRETSLIGVYEKQTEVYETKVAVEKLTADDIKNLTVEQMAELTAAQIAAFDPSIHIKEFTVEQLMALSEEQVAAFIPIQLFNFTDEQAAAIGVTKPEKAEAPAVDPEAEAVTIVIERSREIDVRIDEYTEDRGYFAIIEEGDALTKIYAKHNTQNHEFNSVEISFNPRPKDKYSLNSLSAGGGSGEITVESDRKYVDNYTVKYYMLLDDERAAEAGMSEDEYYETSWMGMATAYRDYLIEKGVLTPLTDEQVGEDIPLYIETFGATKTIEKVLSVPTTVSVALTSFDNIKTMIDELAEAGITNVNFKLTGYANGGMYATIPYKLKWEKAVGGEEGYEELVKYAAEKGIGIYPDFDFAYVNNHKSFDGLKLDRDILKTIDNRYSSLREWDPSLQEFVSYFTLCVSPSAYMTFYEKFIENYGAYENKSISLSTIGSALNSDFDEKDPYNRNDAKTLTMEFLDRVNQDMTSVMSESGNVYTWQYVDKMLNVSLQSSRSLYSTATVPFMGVVLHGSVEFTGSPINMAGDIKYEILRAIENGAGLYFILSYENTELLKEDYTLSNYYSVRYEIWGKGDVVKLDENGNPVLDENGDPVIEKKVEASALAQYYNELNSVLKDLQTSFIVDHEFVIGERVPSIAESKADEEAAKAQKEIDAEAFAVAARNATVAVMRDRYLAGLVAAGEDYQPIVDAMIKRYADGEDAETIIADMQAEYGVPVEVTEEPSEEEPVEESEEEVEDAKEEYEYTKYTSDDNQIVRVTYSNGTSFILNYNDFAVTVEGVEDIIPAYGYVVIK